MSLVGRIRESSALMSMASNIHIDAVVTALAGNRAMRLQRVTVIGAVFLTGAALMALEVAAFRIVGRVFGTALRETTTVIAVFMTAMSIGYWGGGKVGDRWPFRRTLASVLLVAAMAISVIPWLDHSLSLRIAESSASLSLHALIAGLALFFFPVLLLSAVSPIAIRL